MAVDAGDSTTPIRINLGSGPVGPPGWIHLDRSPSMVLSRHPHVRRVLRRLGVVGEQHMVDWSPEIVRRNLTKPLPFADGSVDAVYSSHFLEHVYQAEARRVIAETHRILKPGGVLRLALPDGEVWARELVGSGTDHSGEAGARYQLRLGAHPVDRPRGKAALAFRLGGHIHRWQPTAGLVRSMVREAGFTEINDCSFRSGALPGVEEIETREESFFIEAIR